MLCNMQPRVEMDHMELGRTDLVQHEIDTADQAPIKQPPLRISFLLCHKMLTQGVAVVSGQVQLSW